MKHIYLRSARAIIYSFFFNDPRISSSGLVSSRLGLTSDVGSPALKIIVSGGVSGYSFRCTITVSIFEFGERTTNTSYK